MTLPTHRILKASKMFPLAQNPEVLKTVTDLPISLKNKLPTYNICQYPLNNMTLLFLNKEINIY